MGARAFLLVASFVLRIERTIRLVCLRVCKGCMIIAPEMQINLRQYITYNIQRMLVVVTPPSKLRYQSVLLSYSAQYHTYTTNATATTTRKRKRKLKTQERRLEIIRKSLYGHDTGRGRNCN
jgi:hypothetical protein